MSGRTPERGGRAARRDLGACPSDARARRGRLRRGRRRVRPAPDRARRGDDPGRGAAGTRTARARGDPVSSVSRARCRSRCAAGTPPASGSTYPLTLATSERACRPGRPGRRRRGVRRGTPRGAARRPLGRRAARWRCAPARSRCVTSRRLPRSTHLDETATALLAEVAAAAGLLATWPDAEGNPAWTPTEAFDGWCDEPAAERWRRLASAWLTTERLPFLVGHPRPGRQVPQRARPRADQPDRPRDPGDGPRRPGRAAARARCWRPAPARRPWSARVTWERPRRPPSRTDQVVAALDEAAGARAGRPRRARVVRRGAAGRRGPRAAADAAAARGGRPGPDPGRPDRGRARAADPRARPRACTCWPTSSRAGRPPSTGSPPRRYAARSTPAGRRTRCTPSSTTVSRTPGAATADLPRRRRRPHLRDDPGRPRRGVPARRRRDGARRAAPPPAGRLAGAAPDRADGPGQRDPARRAAAPAARARGLAAGGEHRRHRPRRPARPAAGPARPSGQPGVPRTPGSRPGSPRSSPPSGPATGSRGPASPAGAELTPIGSLAALREAVETGRTVLIGYVDNHGVSSERIVDPGARRRWLAHRARPPGRRRTPVRRAPHPNRQSRGHRSVDWITWISSGTPSRRQRCSTRR